VASQTFTLGTTYQDDAVALPAGLRPQDLHAVQFLLDAAHDAGATIHLDEVRIDTLPPAGAVGFDPLRVIQSYQPAGWAPTNSPPDTPQGRDVNIYPNRSFLYDNPLAIKDLLATWDAQAQRVAIDLADAEIATALPNHSYYNQRNSGHVLLGDGSVRAPFSQ